MHVLGFDPHAFAHFRDERKRRRGQVDALIHILNEIHQLPRTLVMFEYGQKVYELFVGTRMGFSMYLKINNHKTFKYMIYPLPELSIFPLSKYETSFFIML